MLNSVPVIAAGFPPVWFCFCLILDGFYNHIITNIVVRYELLISHVLIYSGDIKNVTRFLCKMIDYEKSFFTLLKLKLL